MCRNKFYFQISVSDEQKDYAKELVDYSMKNHPISNIWDKEKKEQTQKLRFTGTLCRYIQINTTNKVVWCN